MVIIHTYMICIFTEMHDPCTTWFLIKVCSIKLVLVEKNSSPWGVSEKCRTRIINGLSGASAQSEINILSAVVLYITAFYAVHSSFRFVSFVPVIVYLYLQEMSSEKRAFFNGAAMSLALMRNVTVLSFLTAARKPFSAFCGQIYSTAQQICNI